MKTTPDDLIEAFRQLQAAKEAKRAADLAVYEATQTLSAALHALGFGSCVNVPAVSRPGAPKVVMAVDTADGVRR